MIDGDGVCVAPARWGVRGVAARVLGAAAVLSGLAPMSCGDAGSSSASAGSTSTTTPMTNTDGPATVPTTGGAATGDSATEGSATGSATDAVTGDPSTGVAPTSGETGGGTSSTGPGFMTTGSDSSSSSGSTTDPDTGGSMNLCKVPDEEEDAPPPCEEKAPADAFTPEVQWEWEAPSDPNELLTGSFVSPLVGNFTDDNGDGEIDLCDTPDVLITAITKLDFNGDVMATGHIHMLAGDTGVEELMFPVEVDVFVYPAFGDIDGDQLPEVVTADTTGHLIAFAHDGMTEWISPVVGGYRTTFASAQCTTLAIYDLDGDGSPEILFGWEVYDNQGNLLFGDPTNAAEWDTQYWCVTPTAADLDGDGMLEVILGHEAYRADGTLYYKLDGFKPAHPHVADLDDDPEPEVFLTNADGISLLDHTGALLFGPLRPTDPNPSPNCWGKPAVVHDFDGDDVADIAVATCTDYSVYSVGANNVVAKWTQDVADYSGLATATAFDFLGDGVAEAIYADETLIYVFDGKTGMVNLTAPRQSGTLIEYPVVADIDNDGAAEILYVSNYSQGSQGATITALRDTDERWIPARRIWNQYSYHVTNVREDGTIPAQMKNNWELLNTFRTNSQIEKGGVCDPLPQ